MKLVIASDHAGFTLKEHLVRWLREDPDLDVTDLGPENDDSVDYPDFARLLCDEMLSGKAETGILVCNTGIGMSIAANRRKGIRAALCLFPEMARFARHHNDANVLVLGGGITGPFLARGITEVFLGESFDGGRHARRTGKFDLEM
jgi:ribose 5-phosphate isomerase B